ncbi:MAG: RecX family transcriptional regulator [Bacteroidetes bacterium]|nr:RecX family transcriptional regulator [Bacteroidota bacterium]
MEKHKPVKVHTLKTALERLRKYCAYQERTQQEARDKFYDLGLHQKEVEQGVVVLIEEGFLNEERFAIAFAGGKFRIKQWGKNKIKDALRARKISEYCIRKAMAIIDDSEYFKVLEKVVAAKSKLVKEKNVFKRNYKIAQYAMSRGFEQDLIWDLLKQDADG